MWWRPDKFEDKLPFLKKRMAIIKSIRRFFDEQDFWEVETPALQVCPGMDPHIHGFQTTLHDVNMNPLRTLYLHTSPEFPMKKLLVAGAEKIYQICPVFRNGEDTPLHSPAFTLLEWYRTGADYTDIMTDCERLLRYIATAAEIKELRHKDLSCDPFQPFERLTIADAFKTYADIDITQHLDNTASLTKALEDRGIRTAPDDHWDDLFHRVLAEKIEPYLGVGRPCFLYEYPASEAALARKKPDDPRFAERFEIYICGVELANAFGELTDPTEQRQRFEDDMDLRDVRYNGARYPIEEDFLQALEYGMPYSSGIAIGIDRLVMLATGARTIEQVLWVGKV